MRNVPLESRRGRSHLARTLRTRALLVLFGVLTAVPSFSFTFQPISRSFAPAGAGSIQSFQINNTENHNIAVRVSMVTRSMDRNGHETYTSASGQFVVFPSQIVLKPKASQTVRVQWKGPADIPAELSYRIIAEELPVDFGGTRGEGGNINILFRYLGAVYIVPPGAAPHVELEAWRLENRGNRAPGLMLTFKNSGTAHALLSNLHITVTGLGADGSKVSLSFDPDHLRGIDGENMLAGSVRDFYLPLQGDGQGASTGIPEKDIHVDFSFDATK